MKDHNPGIKPIFAIIIILFILAWILILIGYSFIDTIYYNFIVFQMIGDICSVEDFSDFYLHTYYVIAKLGLQRIAKEEKLFEGNEWSNPHCKGYLVKKLKQFLIKYIR